MFRSLFNKTLVFGASALLSSNFLFSDNFKETFDKIDYLQNRALSNRFPWEISSALIYFYDKQESDLQKEKVMKLNEKSSKFGYSLQKVYFEKGISEEILLEKLNISQEELKLRLQYKSNFAFIKDSQIFKAPMGISVSDIDAWVSKCQSPFISIQSMGHFYQFCRQIISSEYDFVLIYHGLTDSEEEAVHKFSRLKYKVPILKLTDESAAELEISEKGFYLVKTQSIYDGDFDTKQQNNLKFLKFTGEFDIENLSSFVKKNSVPSIYFIDSLERAGSLFESIYRGPLKVLYIMTSNLKTSSKKYKKLIQDLHKIKSQFPEQFVVAVVPNDMIGRKLSLLRNKNLRNNSIAEVRFLDFSKIVMTTEENGKFPIIDCSDDKKKCADLIENNYNLRNNLDKIATFENLEEFCKKSLAGDFEHFYEKDTTPSTYVRKLSAGNFKQEVVESEGTVLVELYGKYCPGCISFKNKFSQLAEEMKDDKDITFAKICIDHNMIPESIEMTPYTPIFYIYKKGSKNQPILFEGSLTKDNLAGFVKKHMAQDNNQIFKVV